MVINIPDDSLIEDAIRVIFTDAKPAPDYRERLLNQLLSDYSWRGDKMIKLNRKAAVLFGLAAMVVIGIIVYGLWLPATLNF